MIKTTTLISALLLFSAIIYAASDTPQPRLARALPPDRAEAHAARMRQSEALQALLSEIGAPINEGPSNVWARAEALEQLRTAVTNGAVRYRYEGSTLRPCETRAPALNKKRKQQ